VRSSYAFTYVVSPGGRPAAEFEKGQQEGRCVAVLQDANDCDISLSMALDDKPFGVELMVSVARLLQAAGSPTFVELSSVT